MKAAAFAGEFVDAAAPLVSSMQEVAVAVDEPVADLGLSAVDKELDGLGLGKAEIQVRLKKHLRGPDGRDVESVTAAGEKGVQVVFRREACTTTPEFVQIAPGASMASAFVVAEACSGSALVIAESPDLATTDPIEIALRFPFVSGLALVVGLLVGAFLRPHLSKVRIHTDPNRQRPVFSWVIDLLCGLGILAAWFGGYLAVVAPNFPAIDPQGGFLAKLFTGLTCGLIGMPGLSAWLKKLVRQAKA